MARPNSSQYERFVADGGLAKVRIMKMNGLKDYEIFNQIGISKQTFYKWRKDHSDFSDALKSGLNESINDANKSLVSKFSKSTLTETKVEEWTDSNGKKRQHVTRTTREVAPDTTAIIFFLKSKAGWRDNYDVIDTSDAEKVFEMLKQTQQYAESLPDLPEEEVEDGAED